MDEARARSMAAELNGKAIGKWTIGRFLGSGKSAIVFQATNGSEIAAIKVFDPDIVERFGRVEQLGRIRRELSLCGNHHPNLVRILDGGECPDTKFLFVVMEFIDAPNLHDIVQVVPRDRIWPLISQVADAVRFLETLSLAHRDIKPQNIAVTRDYQTATLLDLGVLRPFGDGSLTDDKSRVFIGTHRYGPPEFLFRREEDTPDGWRAISFYQIGGVLHDLIMRKPLFDDFSEPFAALIEAVKSERPIIDADDVPAELKALAGNCLVKDPNLRLQLVSWDNFYIPNSVRSPIAMARERIRNRIIAAQDKTPAKNAHDSNELRREREIQHERIMSQLDAIIRLECVGNPAYPPISILTFPDLDSGSVLVVTFERSSVHALLGFLGIALKMSFLDLSAEAIELSWSSSIARANLPGSYFSGGKWGMLFKGVFDEPLIKERINALFLLLFDKAQSLNVSEVESEAYPLTIDQTWEKL